MYTFFYPETGERFSPSKELEFDALEAAIEYWRDRRSTWEEIKPINPSDKAAFMQPSSGHIVVVRQLILTASDAANGVGQAPEMGDKSSCKHCHKPIEYIGPYWRHITYSPRHIAEPLSIKHI